MVYLEYLALGIIALWAIPFFAILAFQLSCIALVATFGKKAL